MVIVRLWGGIGNQLFQYSFGELLRERYQVEVVYDIASFGKSDVLRKFELSIIISNLPIISNIAFSRYVGIRNRFLRLSYTLRNTFIEEKQFTEEKLLRGLNKGDVYLQGYWQNREFVSFIKKNKLYLPKESCPNQLSFIKEQIQGADNSVAIHVRRGDYFTPKNINVFGVCDISYYEKAIDLLRSKISTPIIFVFSDDLDWVKENIDLPLNTIYVPNYDLPQYWYIYLMSLCRHNIISNSTFSWWGAVLNTNVNKIVISPAIWTLNSKKTIALDEWIKI